VGDPRWLCWSITLALAAVAVGPGSFVVATHLPGAAAPGPSGTPVGNPAAGVHLAQDAPPWAPARTLLGATHSLATGVNPYAIHTTEPAPMGIADYGVDALGNGYVYTTPVWLADANISRMLAYAPSNTTANSDITFQLNVVVEFTNPVSHATYLYWIQNVINSYTVQQDLQFLDNVWNLSSSYLDAASATGNGSVNYCPASACGVDVYWYADVPPCSASNCVVVQYPTEVKTRVSTGLVGGVPHVAFQYLDVASGGWVTYDNVSFPFAQGFTDNGFVVDGTQYAPIGNFRDAEWDYTGPPGGGTMTDRNTSMRLSLQYWNGHNYEAPPNAYNFGSDTAELMSHVQVGLAADPTNGALRANLSTMGTPLGNPLTDLYFRSDVGELRVASPNASAGTLWVAGSPYPFTGGSAALTLAPGTYAVAITDLAGDPIANGTATLAAGGTTTLTLGIPRPFPVAVSGTGLPTGSSFTITIGGTPYVVTGTLTLDTLVNGTYAYTIAPFAGYHTARYAGTIVVNGAPVALVVAWTPFVYDVTFSETGLPPGTPWSVNLAGQLTSSTGTEIAFTEGNGSFGFSVDAGATYLADPPTGSITVAATAFAVTVAFTLRPGYIAGLLTPAAATIWIDGAVQSTSDGTFNATTLPGVHAIEVVLAGYAPYFTNVTVTAGGVATVDVTLTPAAPGGGSPGPTGGPGGVDALTAAILIGGAVAVVAVVLVAVAHGRGRRR